MLLWSESPAKCEGRVPKNNIMVIFTPYSFTLSATLLSCGRSIYCITAWYFLCWLLTFYCVVAFHSSMSCGSASVIVFVTLPRSKLIQQVLNWVEVWINCRSFYALLSQILEVHCDDSGSSGELYVWLPTTWLPTWKNCRELSSVAYIFSYVAHSTEAWSLKVIFVLIGTNQTFK